MGFQYFLSVVFWSVLFFDVKFVLSACYNPDGSQQTGPAYEPCVQTVGTVSMCCGTNVRTKLFYVQFTQFWRFPLSAALAATSTRNRDRILYQVKHELLTTALLVDCHRSKN